MASVSTGRARSLQILATYPLAGGRNPTNLCVVQGSVVDFPGPTMHPKKNSNDATSGKKTVYAIVNAANEQCLGGGGVDGAITTAGGRNLARDRQALPLMSKPLSNTNIDDDDDDAMMYMEEDVRCPTGYAVITGPGKYGSLHVPYVVHAVGPNYTMYNGFETPDRLLQFAYQSSLDCCRENGITDVAFSLLSAGVFRGRRRPEDVLRIGVLAIRNWSARNSNDDPSSSSSSSTSSCLNSITLCGFSDQETMMLIDICEAELSNDKYRLP